MSQSSSCSSSGGRGGCGSFFAILRNVLIFPPSDSLLTFLIKLLRSYFATSLLLLKSQKKYPVWFSFPPPQDFFPPNCKSQKNGTPTQTELLDIHSFFQNTLLFSPCGQSSFGGSFEVAGEKTSSRKKKKQKKILVRRRRVRISMATLSDDVSPTLGGRNKLGVNSPGNFCARHLLLWGVCVPGCSSTSETRPWTTGARCATRKRARRVRACVCECVHVWMWMVVRRVWAYVHGCGVVGGWWDGRGQKGTSDHSPHPHAVSAPAPNGLWLLFAGAATRDRSHLPVPKPAVACCHRKRQTALRPARATSPQLQAVRQGAWECLDHKGANPGVD